MRARFPPQHYTEGILRGDRVVLSQAITLIESRLPADRDVGHRLLTDLLPHTGHSVRVGITGVPGVGKSTFIEAFGSYLTGLGKRLAVLTVDPSSPLSRGSILGDKTRMERLSRDPLAYIRPSAAGTSAGGVADATREALLLCEAAGFEVILVETVGVGQSEVLVKGMVDFFLLLMLAGAGDELQGVKRGIMEMADALLITKADGENGLSARRARTEYESALHLFPKPDSGWSPPVRTCSALTGEGVAEAWTLIQNFITLTKQNGFFETNRQQQRIAWLHQSIRRKLDELFFQNPLIQSRLAELEAAVRTGEALPVQAASELLGSFGPQ